MDRVRTYGLAGVGGILVIPTIVFAIGARDEGYGPPETVPRAFVLGLLFAVPAVIAALGVARRSAPLLAAAGLAALAPAWLSVATLPLVIPALLLIVAAASAARPERRSGWLVAIAIVALQVAALVAVFTNTEQRCWLAYESPGGLIYREASEAETHGLFGLPGGPVGGGCDGGALTERGVALAAVLSLGGLALAFASRRRTAVQPFEAGP
ncbi:MAG: hypothetical protein L0221_01375 [Chloroflexi bacterium]|nr:hypothetical protein [Chloroflexota bacterium]